MAPHTCLALLSTLLFIQWTKPVSAACYFPSGDLASNDSPCRDDTENSLCCGQGYACLTNNVCQATGDELQKPGATEFVRGSCTDKNWRSSSCPSFCIDPDLDNPGGGEGMGKCKDTTKDLYYCIDGNVDQVDCDKDDNVLFFPGTPSAITTIGVSPVTSTSTSSTSSTDTTTSTTVAPQTSASPSQTSGGPSASVVAGKSHNQDSGSGSDNKGAIIGGAVGGSVAVILLGGLAMWWFSRNRKRKAANGQEGTENTYRDQIMAQYDNTIHEAPTTPRAYKVRRSPSNYEVSTGSPPQELPTNFGEHR